MWFTGSQVDSQRVSAAQFGVGPGATRQHEPDPGGSGVVHSPALGPDYVGLNITIATYHPCNFGQMTSSPHAPVSPLVRWA